MTDLVESPCVSVCTLDENDICEGCGRTLPEIMGWTRMTESEKENVLCRIFGSPSSNSKVSHDPIDSGRRP